MIRLLSLAAVAAVVFASGAQAFEIKGNVGIAQLQSQSSGNAVSGGAGAFVGVGHQDAASAGTAGAQLQVKPSGVTVLTSQTSATSTNQAAFGLNGGLSFAGTQNASAGAWSGLAGALKF